MRDEILRLAKKYRHYEETDKEREEYINNFWRKFYLYIRDDKLLGYVDYIIDGKTLVIVDLICEGNFWDMWKYGSAFMKANKLEYMEFKRKKYNDVWKKYKRTSLLRKL